MGIYISAATMENSTKVPQEIKLNVLESKGPKMELLYDLAISLLGKHPKEIKTGY